VNDLDRVRSAAAAADGVIHAAFNHDFTRLKENCEEDRKVIEALGQALAGSDRPLVVASGTGVARRSKTGALALESDDHVTSAEAPPRRGGGGSRRPHRQRRTRHGDAASPGARHA
jgi:hypothetical protein